MKERTLAKRAGRAHWVCVLVALLAGCAQPVSEATSTSTPRLPDGTPDTPAVAAALTTQMPTEIPARTTTPRAPTAASTPRATVPSTPLPTPFSTPLTGPLPTPTTLALVVLPSGTGDGPPDLAGEIRSAQGAFEQETHASGKQVYRFTDSLVLEVNVTAIPAGARVSEVLFRFSSLDNVTDFDSRTERTPLYCAFGGGEPECAVLRLEPAARWPNSGAIVTNGVYCFSGRALLDSGATRTWRLLVEIDSPNLPTDPSGGIAPVSGTVPPASPCLR